MPGDNIATNLSVDLCFCHHCPSWKANEYRKSINC